MRRLWPVAILSLFLITGCGGKVVSPVAQTVVGKLPTSTTPAGDPAAGKTQFMASGCTACHTFRPAASNGKVGPDLDNLKAAAAKAGEPLDQYVQTSIQDPNAYITPGYKSGVMPMLPLTPTQVANLVAFLTKSS